MKSLEVDQCVERIAEGLDRGLSLEDLDGVLLSYGSHRNAADKVRVNFLLSKRVPEDVGRWQLQHGISTAVRPVVVPANEELGMLGRVCVPLLVRGFRVGYLWVQQDPEELAAAAILERLPAVRGELDLLVELLLDSNTAASEQRRQLESGFLAACSGNEEAQQEVAHWPVVQHRGPWRLGVLLEYEQGMEPTEDPQASLLAHRTAALHATVGHDAASFSAGRETHAVVLFRGLVAEQEFIRVQRGYREELDKRSGRKAAPVILGLSEPFNDVGGLPDACRQARQAVQAAAVDPQLARVSEYCNLGVYQHFAAEAAGPSGPRSTRFRELSAGDPARELRPLLELLYDHSGSVQDVADVLHLHRSTLYNRLARVRSIIGADPMVGVARLELHVALKTARWAERPRI
ncbi:helix-turn-helix domain-containing protein [Arthrobacter roseus]|uniref:helix-turn-helix domain-containing protein n=1 Tax=Arthrobacter roseus TaxID=136274 RepID=UPI001963F05F|nr:helix-turn-helix domain-containing protein [Arthrobacter roseus]